MTSCNTDPRQERVHQRTWELLPAYVDGAVESRERQDIEAHLSTCTACQAELAHCRDVANKVRMTGDHACRPSPALLSRVMAGIEASEVHLLRTQRWREAWRDLWCDYQRILQQVPPFIRWGLAVQGALLVLLAGAIAWQVLFS